MKEKPKHNNKVWDFWSKFASELSGNYVTNEESGKVLFVKDGLKLSLSRGVHSTGERSIDLSIHQPEGRVEIHRGESKTEGDLSFSMHERYLKKLKQEDPDNSVKLDSSYDGFYPSLWVGTDQDPKHWLYSLLHDSEGIPKEGILAVRFNFAEKSNSRAGGDTKSSSFWTTTKVTVSLIVLAVAAIGVGCWMLHSTLSSSKPRQKDVKSVPNANAEPDVENLPDEDANGPLEQEV